MLKGRGHFQKFIKICMVMCQSRDCSDCGKEGQVGSKGDQSDLKS